MMDQKSAGSTEPTKKWQFSLRSIFVLTTVCAVYLGLVARDPIAIKTSLMILCGLVIAITFLGVTLGMTALLQWIVLRLRAKAPKLLAWIFGGEDNSQQR